MKLGKESVVEDREALDLAALVNEAVAPVGNLTSADLARKAGISDNTLAKIKRGERVTRRSAEKVRAALGAPPVADVPMSAFPADVQLVQKMVGMWLMGMDDEARAHAVYGLVRHMGEPVPNGPNGPSSERLTWLRGR